MDIDRTTAEELARVIDDYLRAGREFDSAFLAQAILASPVIAKIERDAEIEVAKYLRRKADNYSAWDYAEADTLTGAARAIEAGEHKEKAGG